MIGANAKKCVSKEMINVTPKRYLKRYNSGLNQDQSNILSWESIPVSFEANNRIPDQFFWNSSLDSIFAFDVGSKGSIV